jgi:hypothetical protein
MKLKILFITVLACTNNIYASSAIYSSIETGEHFLVRNQASGDEAEPKARRHCEDEYGIGL